MDGTHRRESQIVHVRNRLLKPPTRASQSLPTRATSQPSRNSPLSIIKMFGNPDVKSEVYSRYDSDTEVIC
jgi:hypothetical protein